MGRTSAKLEFLRIEKKTNLCEKEEQPCLLYLIQIFFNNGGDDFDYENYDVDNQDQAYELCQQQCLLR